MIVLLRGLFGIVLASMLAVTSWASLHTPLFEVPRTVATHPWFIATLVDAYWGFVTFYIWVAWKEQSLGARLLWFVVIIALGNIAMAVYFLRELFRVRATAELGGVICSRNSGSIALPCSLTVVAVLVYLLAV